jgi:hypothetical protein
MEAVCIQPTASPRQASAPNLAVFRGDAGLTEVLLAHRASWREEHGCGDDVIGTLSWTSSNEPVADGDWAARARALVAYGLPAAEHDPASVETIVILTLAKGSPM